MKCPQCKSTEVYYFRGEFLCKCRWRETATHDKVRRWESETIDIFLEDCVVDDFKKELNQWGRL